MITKLITANVTNAQGFTYQWVVQETSSCTGFTVGQILGVGNVTANTQAIELEVIYPDDCVQLEIKLVLLYEGSICEFLLFDIINDTTVSDHHWECLGEGEEYYCSQILGLPYLSTHYTTFDECIVCNNCACGIDSPCRLLTFNGVYTCPVIPGGNGVLTITLMSSSGEYLPVTIDSISMNNSIIHTCTYGCELQYPGNTYIVPLTLSPGSYNIILNISAEDDVCPINPISVSANCQYGGGPTVSGDLYCCQEVEPFDDGSVGNVGGVNVYILYYGTTIDENDDIVIDFGANSLSDKLEVYKGIVSPNSIINDIVTPGLLIASIPYIGATANCRNIIPCFEPAVGTTGEVRNDVVQGIIEYSGVYSGQTGITYASRGLFSSPDFATELMGTGATHTVLGAYPDWTNSYSNPGNGGPNSGIGRLRILGGTYANTDKKLTIAVHNNNAENYSPDCPPPCDGINDPLTCCSQNATAWKFYVHCPTCPTCQQKILSQSSCNDDDGLLEVFVAEGSFTAPVNIKVYPSLADAGNVMPDMLSQMPLYIYYTGNSTAYPVTLGSNYAEAIINVDIVSGETLVIFTDSIGGLTKDVYNGLYETFIIDANGCNLKQYMNVLCDCLVTYNVSGATDLCKDEDLALDIILINSSCINSEGTILDWDVSPANPSIVINPHITDTDKFTISNTATLVSGTYNITFSFICPDGCYLENVTAEVTVRDWSCNPTSVLVDTTCGNTTGSITLRLCSGQTILGWEGVTGTSSVLTNLGAGLYTVEIEDRYGCLKSYDYFISDSSAVSLNVDPLNIDCSSSVVSSMFFYISGGIPDYTLNLYRLSGSYTLVYTNADYDDLEVILSASVTGGLIVGTYRAVAIDASGCTTTIEFNITQDFSLSPSVYPQSTSCNLQNGYIRVYIPSYNPAEYQIYYVSGTQICDYAKTYGQQLIYGAGEVILGYVDTPLLVSGQYTVCLYNVLNDCCKCVTTLISNVQTPPANPTIINPTICEGSSVNLLPFFSPYITCTLGAHIEIYDSNYIKIYDALPAFGSSTVYPLATTTYYARCVNNCFSAYMPIVVTVIPIPDISTQTINKCITSSSTPIFTETCEGASVPTWSYFGNTVSGNTFSTSLLAPYINTTPSAPLSQTIPVNLTCTSGNCTSVSTYNLIVWKDPVIQTQPLSFCLGTSITEAMLAGAVLPLAAPYTGYTISDIDYYSDSDCTIPQTFPFTLTAGVTKYVKVSTLYPGAPTGCTVCECASTCLPIVINTAPFVTLPITHTITCNGNGTYNVLLTNTGVGNGSATGHLWSWNNALVLVSGNTGSTLLRTNVLPGTYPAAVTYNAPGICPGAGSTTITLPAYPVMTPQPDHQICFNDPGLTISLSVDNATVTNLITTITPIGGATINGSNVVPNMSVIGTTTINVTASNSAGCIVTDSFNITVINCDPCVGCTMTLDNLDTTDSSITFSDMHIAGQSPTSFVIAVRELSDTCPFGIGDEPIAYVRKGSTAVTYSGVPIINVTTPNWNLPLVPGQYNLFLESASGGVNPALYAQCITECCSTTVDVICADCTLSKSYSAILTEEESAVYKMCIPCNNNCFKIKFDAGGSAPDKLEVFTSSTLSPASLIYEDTWDTNIIDWKVIKLNNASTLYNVSAQCSGIPSMTALWIKITSYQGSGTPEITTWNINTECCNCITTCPPMAYPCVSAITEYVDPTGVYYATMKELPSSISNLCNGCLSSCWNLNLANIDGNSSTDICGWINSFIVDDLYNCNTISQKRIQPLFNRCDIGPIGSNDDYFKINGMTTFWDVVNYTYTMTFDFAAEATIMYNWLIRGVNPTGEGIISYPTVSQAFMEYFPTLTECGDDPVKDSISIPLGCYTTSADTAYATITQFSANIIKIDYAINPSTISYTLCSGCTYNRDYNFPNISSNDFLQIHPAADINYSKEATVVRADFHYGLFSQECPLGARYRFSMTDNTYTDPDKWILTTSNNNTIYCVSGVGALTLTGNQIIQYGSSYATSGDVVADILSGNILTMSGLTTTLHPYAVSGENNCFTGS